jgi:sugar-specific transcriptional regulator TrmB
MNSNLKKTNKTLIEQLCQLGFTQLESEIYLFLLTNGEHTGYAIAKGIGKAVANVYKGVEGLSIKGAIKLTVGDSKICSAVPWKQVLELEQSRFENNISSLSEQLRQLPKQLDNESVYQLKNISQVLTAGEQIIREAQHILVGELEPKVADYYAPLLADAAGRGVEVRIKVYQPIVIENVHLTLRKNGEVIYAGTKDVSFKICADGRESLTAALTSDLSNVIQAFNTKSALVCMDTYCGIIYELILTELKQAIPDNNMSVCQEILDSTEHLHPFSTQNKVFSEYKTRYKQ